MMKGNVGVGQDGTGENVVCPRFLLAALDLAQYGVMWL